MKRIYLDYAATTPVDPRVVKAMLPYFSENFGNTMSLHSFGQDAKLVLEQSRETVANLIGAEPNEIIFTSSATESNNQALKGIALSERSESKGKDEKNHIIISSIEHPCIIESAKWLEKCGCLPDGRGFKITKLPVDKYGLVSLKDLESAITDKTILVSIIHASNEIGTIEPIAEIGEMIKKINLSRLSNTQHPTPKIYFHTDASQSFGKIAIDVKKMNIDLLTASSHKIYGPKGAGLLYVRNGLKIEPLLHGGGQENGLRSSTVNIAAIVGFAKAVEICQKEMKKENKKLEKLRDKLIKGVLKIKGSHLNGHPKNRLANIINIWFSFIEGESLVIQLDLHGIACSTGSACSSVKLEPSPILLAIGLKPQEAHGSLRISLGRQTTEKDINYLLKILPKIVKKIREISPFK